MKHKLIRIGEVTGLRLDKRKVEQPISPQPQPRQGWKDAFRAASTLGFVENPWIPVLTFVNQFDSEEWKW